MTPLDLDGAALRALRGLCGEVLSGDHDRAVVEA